VVYFFSKYVGGFQLLANTWHCRDCACSKQWGLYVMQRHWAEVCRWKLFHTELQYENQVRDFTEKVITSNGKDFLLPFVDAFMKCRWNACYGKFSVVYVASVCHIFLSTLSRSVYAAALSWTDFEYSNIHTDVHFLQILRANWGL